MGPILSWFAAALRRGHGTLAVVPTETATRSTAAAAGLLDGRSFEGVFIPRGKTQGDADTLQFRNGRFHSLACDQHGLR